MKATKAIVLADHVYISHVDILIANEAHATFNIISYHPHLTLIVPTKTKYASVYNSGMFLCLLFMFGVGLGDLIQTKDCWCSQVIIFYGTFREGKFRNQGQMIASDFLAWKATSPRENINWKSIQNSNR